MNHQWNGPPTANRAGKFDPNVRSSKQDNITSDSQRRADVLAKCKENISLRKESNERDPSIPNC